MEAPKTNPKHEKFISEMILHGDKLRAYKAAYPNATDEAARTASSRLMNNPYIKEKLSDASKQVHMGLADDKLSFIYQELKIINKKRIMLLGIITGNRKATVSEQLKALRLDNELAEQQAQLLGYGSIKPAKQTAPQKNTESVTKMNNEPAPEPPLHPTKSNPGNDLVEKQRPNRQPLPVTPVTNYTPYSCGPIPTLVSAKDVLPDIELLLSILEGNRNISPGNRL